MDELKIARLDAKAGDTIVLKVHGRITDETQARLHKYATDQLPDGVKVMVIDESVDISVVGVDGESIMATLVSRVIDEVRKQTRNGLQVCR